MRRLIVFAALGLVFALAAGCASDAGPRDESAALRPVVVIVVDALRADHLGTYGYDARPTSPNIDRWADRALVFERAWSTSSWTLPAFGSLLTGYLPSAHAAGVEAEEDVAVATEVAAARRFVTLPGGVPTLAGRLTAAGIATGAFVANPFLDPRFGLARGFAYYDHAEASNEQARRAGEVVDAALEWIDARPRPGFFLMIHLMDPHLNYDAPPPFRGRFTGAVDGDHELPVKNLWPIRNRVAGMDASERDFIGAAYDEEVAYVDAEVGRFLDGLERRGVLTDGLVLLTSDHGEELFEHGGFEHGHTMYEEVLRVPMIVWGAGVSPGRATLPVSLIDVAPTVLHALGLAPDGRGAGVTAGDENRAVVEDGPSAEGTRLPGVSLLDGARPLWPAERLIVAERLLYGAEAKAAVRWPHKVIARADDERFELYDLAADPGERGDLADARPELLADMLGLLAERLARAEALDAGVPAQLDEELLRRLRALGYVR